MTSLIRPLDIVRLRHSPDWRGRVSIIEEGQVMVFALQSPWAPVWLAMEWVELAPGNDGVFVA